MRQFLDPTRRVMLGLYLLLLNLYDVFITRYIIHSGNGVESNPVMQGWIHQTQAVIAVKMFFVGLVWLTALAETKRPRQATGWLWLGVLWYGSVAVWNTIIVM